MKIIESIDELKVGDKIDAVTRPKSYDDYGIVYILVEHVLYTAKIISVSYIDYKGKIIATASFSIPHSFVTFKFYEP